MKMDAVPDDRDREASDERDSKPPAKPPKNPKSQSGAAKYKSKFCEEWSRRYNFIVKGENSHSVHCNICNRSLSCGHMGFADVERHVRSKLHTRNVNGMKLQVKLPTRSLKRRNPITDQVTRAEVKVATLLVQNNIPLTLADELTLLFPDIFPDSKIAKNFSSRRSKTACIINGAVAPYFKSQLISHMIHHPFSLAIDGSSDKDVETMNLMTARVFDNGKVSTQFLDMCMTSESTVETLCLKMDDVLCRHHIQWENCVGLAVDNCLVNNMGYRSSIKTHVLQKNPATYIMGCGCHIVHNTASKASDAFEQMTEIQGLVDSVCFLKTP